MKLFFDARYIRTDYHDGISRYSAELAHALAATQSSFELTFLICDEKQRSLLPPDAQTVMLHKPTSFKEPFTSLLLNRHQPDVVFSPMQTIGSFGRRFRLIVTSHDMIYFRHKTPPHHLPFWLRVGWRLYHSTYAFERFTLNRADIVATVSHTVKQQFEKHRLTKRPIVVIGNAPSNQPRKPATQDGPLNDIVYMGSFMEYKNVECLIAMMAWLPGRRLHLLSRISPQRQASLEKLRPEGAKVIFHNGVTDEAYQQLLSKNAVLVTASLDEGYGLPIIEAMAQSVPVVVSDIPIFREVAGKAAFYAKPNDPQQFAEAIIQLDDLATRRTRITQGVRHAAGFRWRDSAEALITAATSVTIEANHGTKKEKTDPA